MSSLSNRLQKISRQEHEANDALATLYICGVFALGIFLIGVAIVQSNSARSIHPNSPAVRMSPVPELPGSGTLEG